MDKETPAAEREVLEEDQEHYGEGDVTDAKPDRKGRFILFGRWDLVFLSVCLSIHNLCNVQISTTTKDLTCFLREKKLL